MLNLKANRNEATNPVVKQSLTVNRLLVEVREQGTGNREQWEELEFLGIKLI
jgi:hypothetical protein